MWDFILSFLSAKDVISTADCFPAVCPALPTLFHVTQKPCESSNRKTRKLRLTEAVMVDSHTAGKVGAGIQMSA